MSSLTLPLSCQTRGWEVKDVLSSYFLGNGTRANLKDCTLGMGLEAETRIKAKGTGGHGARQLLHGDSGDGNPRWPPRTETQRQACGKPIRCPFPSPTTI